MCIFAKFDTINFFTMKAILILAVALLSVSCSQKQTTMEQKPSTVEIIQTRASVRQFTMQKPTEEQIDTLLRCAFSAPTAMNKQPWHFMVIDEPALLQKIGESFPYSRVANNCQVCFVPCGDMTLALEGNSKDFWIQDVSAATENLLLAAHAMGLGAVWTGLYPDVERVGLLRELLGLPDHIVPLCIVPVGYPAEQPAVKDKYKAERIHRNEW